MTRFYVEFYDALIYQKYQSERMVAQRLLRIHFSDAQMIILASQITSVSIFLFNRSFRLTSKRTSKPALLAFVRGIHRCPVDSLKKGR